jgi:betaine-homocysteine S-methyltransferase
MDNDQRGSRRGLLERLDEGSVICAEGYLFELERRGYLQAGAFVPEVVLEHPELVAQLHREFVHAGSDVVEAFTYYGRREKLRLIGKEHLLEPLNRQALRLASEVARGEGALLAGNICNTNIFFPNAEARETVAAMFEEQVAWATEAGVDFIIGETFSFGEEALLATEAIKRAGLPAVVTLAIHRLAETREGWTPSEACMRLEQAGADVVGLNCIRGPQTMLPMLADIRAAVSCHVAALPVPCRTTPEQPSFQSLQDPHYDSFPNGRPFPTGLDPFMCTRYEMGDFARAAHDHGVGYLGACCGAGLTTSGAWRSPRSHTARQPLQSRHVQARVLTERTRRCPRRTSRTRVISSANRLPRPSSGAFSLPLPRPDAGLDRQRLGCRGTSPNRPRIPGLVGDEASSRLVLNSSGQRLAHSDPALRLAICGIRFGSAEASLRSC